MTKQVVLLMNLLYLKLLLNSTGCSSVLNCRMRAIGDFEIMTVKYWQKLGARRLEATS